MRGPIDAKWAPASKCRWLDPDQGGAGVPPLGLAATSVFGSEQLMPLDLAALQLFFPIALLIWLAVTPAWNIAGFWLHVGAIGLTLLALGSAGLWLLPPWWAPYLFGALWLGTSVIAYRNRRKGRPFWPKRWKQWLSITVSLSLSATALVALSAAHGGLTTSTKVVALAPALRGGPYLVTNGGSSELINAHVKTLVPTRERMLDYRGQSYGVDIVKLGPLGLRASGLRPRDPTAYRIFGERLYAPCSGLVLHAEDGLPDLPIPEMDREHMAGNHVLLQCADADVLLAHMREGSVAVATGDKLAVGAHVGAVGNSGNSGEPHLHIHAQTPGTAAAPLSGDPLQITIAGRFLVRNDRVSYPEER